MFSQSLYFCTFTPLLNFLLSPPTPLRPSSFNLCSSLALVSPLCLLSLSFSPMHFLSPLHLRFLSASITVKSCFIVLFAGQPSRCNRIAPSYMDNSFQGNRDGGEKATECTVVQSILSPECFGPFLIHTACIAGNVRCGDEDVGQQCIHQPKHYCSFQFM